MARFRWDWDYTWAVLPQLLQAMGVTVQATAAGMALALLIGLVLALCRRAPSRLLAWPAASVVEFIRSTPLVAQLFFLFYVLPHAGITLSPFLTGVIGLGLHYGSYTAEVYRAGIEAVDQGQWHAALALNFSRRHIWTRIILPQAIPPIIPALGNYLIAMFKETPQLSAITVIELLQRASLIGTRSFRYLEPMTLVGILFFLLSYPSALVVQRLEVRFAQKR